MADWLAGNLDKLKELVDERLEIVRQEGELHTRRENLDKLEQGLKTLVEIALATNGDAKAKAQYRRICRFASKGDGTQPALNKTHVILDILKQEGDNGLSPAAIQPLLASRGVEVDRNYIHTVLGKLRNNRGLVRKKADLYFLTDKGKAMKLKV